MKDQKSSKRAGIVAGTFLAAAVAGFASTPSNANEANSNLLDFDVLGSGTEIMADVSKMNGNMYRTLELKCGEGKCGEGKCGAEAKEKAESSKKEKATEAKAKKRALKKDKKVKKANKKKG